MLEGPRRATHAARFRAGRSGPPGRSRDDEAESEVGEAWERSEAADRPVPGDGCRRRWGRERVG